MTQTLQHPYAVKIGDCVVIIGGFYCLTVWPQEVGDRGHVLMVRAFPEGTEAQKATAEELGYVERPEDTAVAQMTREHDFLHSLVSVRLFGLPCSPTLRAVAEGTQYPPAPVEEERVMAFQRMLNAPESACPPGWRALRAEAIALLR